MNVATTHKSIYNNQHDSWRRLYIKLLTSELEPWVGWGAERIALEGGAIEDLIVAGYLDGKVHRDAAGVIAFVESRGPTLAGRLFAEEQQDILDKKSLWGRIKSGTGLFVGWVAGIISAMIVWRLTK
jgi:hypothetical protein